MPGILLPVGRFASAGDHHARTIARLTGTSRNSRGQMHQAGDRRKDALGVVDQADQLAEGCPAAEIQDAVKAGMIMFGVADLHEEDSVPKMIHDGLPPFVLPPFDREIKFPASRDKPEGDLGVEQ